MVPRAPATTSSTARYICSATLNMSRSVKRQPESDRRASIPCLIVSLQLIAVTRQLLAGPGLSGGGQLAGTGLRATTSSPRRTSSPDPSLTMTSPWAGTTSGSAGRVEVGGGGIAAVRPQEEGCMAVITRGFGGRRRDDTDLPPGQYPWTTSALSCSGDGTGSPRRFRRFGVILRTRRERTRSAHGDRLDRLVFLVGWHVGVRGELIVGRLAPSWGVLPFAALAGRAAEHPVDRPRKPGR